MSMTMTFATHVIGVCVDVAWSFTPLTGDPAQDFAIAATRNPGRTVSLCNKDGHQACYMMATRTLVIDIEQLEALGLTKEDLLATLLIANVFVKGVIRVDK